MSKILPEIKGSKKLIQQDSEANLTTFTTGNLNNGLSLMGKACLNSREWTGKFAEQQHKHQYPIIPDKQTAFGKQMSKQFEKFKLTIKQCSLCLSQKPRDQFYFMCKCHHDYCYNCLNTYAISRVQDSSPVICPQQDCHETMPLTSQIYKYLPDQIKIKFLNNRHVWKNKVDSLCQRCLEEKHPGECKYALKPTLIDNAYHYRQCSKCKTQINITSGRRRVQCSKCGHKLCYFCGTDWQQEKTGENHVCGNKGEILRKQKQFKDQAALSCANCVQCCNCDTDCCECNCCECDCCRNCGDDLCCQVCFHCETYDCGLFCIIWNMLSIPIRLVFTSLVLGILVLVCGTVAIIPVLWLIMGIFVGFTAVTCEVICNRIQGPLKIVACIFCPFVGFYGTFLALKQTSECVTNLCSGIFQTYCGMIGSIWIDCSPKKCMEG